MRNYLLNTNDLFDDLMRDFWQPTQMAKLSNMATDAYKEGGGYRLEIDIPGFEKDEINISYEKEYLTVQAERKVQEDEKTLLLNERRVSLKRSYLVKAIDGEKITAKYEKGVLTVNLPLKEKEEVKKIAIE